MNSDAKSSDRWEVLVSGNADDLAVLQEALRSRSEITAVGEITTRSEPTSATRQPFALAQFSFEVVAGGLGHLTAIAAWEMFIAPHLPKKNARDTDVQEVRHVSGQDATAGDQGGSK